MGETVLNYWKRKCYSENSFTLNSTKHGKNHLSAYAILHLPHKSPSNQSPRKTLKKVWQTLTKFDYPKNASRQNLLAEKLLYFHCLFFWEKRFTFLSHYFHLKNLQFKIIHIKNITNRITISPKYSFILYPNQHCFKLFTT